MIGNFSFEEHDRYFTRMYNHLKFIDRTLDDAIIINVIKSKVMIEQELENIMYNLNIKNISDTPIVKDFKIWSTKYDLYSSETQSEAQSNEDETQSEAQSNEDEDSKDEDSETQSEDEIDSDDVYDSEIEYFFNRNRYNGNRYNGNDRKFFNEIPEDY